MPTDIIPEAVVVDPSDGYTWSRASERPFTLDEAIAWADMRNEGLREDAPRYRVFKLVPPMAKAEQDLTVEYLAADGETHIMLIHGKFAWTADELLLVGKLRNGRDAGKVRAVSIARERVKLVSSDTPES